MDCILDGWVELLGRTLFPKVASVSDCCPQPFDLALETKGVLIPGWWTPA